MKKFILFITVAAVFTACSSKTKQADTASDSQQQLASDTAGFAEYQNWKQQKEQLQPIDMNGVSGVPTTQPVATVQPLAEATKPATKIIYRDRIVKVSKTPKYSEPQPPETDNTYTLPRPAGPTREATSRNNTGMNTNGGAGIDTAVAAGTGTGVAVAKPAEAPAKKEGWSKAAKGTAIGAASGAVVGAIISKNKGLGAVVGGVVGGLGGYAIGRSKDKKDGRYLVINN